MTELAKRIPQLLQERLLRGKCVAFVGNGFAIPADMPSFDRLALDLVQLARNCGVETSHISLSHTSPQASSIDLASIQAIRHEVPKEQLRKFFRDAYDSRKLSKLDDKQRARIHSRMRSLVNGPWAGILTTNYDHLVDDSFLLFGSNDRPHKCDCEDPLLGTILSFPPANPSFVVRLHKETLDEHTPISEAQYWECFRKSKKITDFVNALQLHFSIVFLGCKVSLDFFEFRRRLWAEFDENLPAAYAIVPDTNKNRSMQNLVKQQYGVSMLFYDRDEDHLQFDEFLTCFGRFADASLSVAPRSRNLLQDYESIGEINRLIIMAIHQQQDHRLSYQAFIDPELSTLKIAGPARRMLRSLAPMERVYRVMYMVGKGLLNESKFRDASYYGVSDELLGICHSELLTMNAESQSPEVSKLAPANLSAKTPKPSSPSVKHNVFISYSRASNSAENGQKGWVRNFHDQLKNILHERIPGINIFLDDKSIEGNAILDESILQAIRDAAVLVVILSPSYLTRPYCNLELQSFRQKFESSEGCAPHIFVVHKEFVPLEQRPEVLKLQLGFQFYHQDPNKESLRYPLNGDSVEFRDRIYDLAGALQKHLEELDR